MSMQVNTYVVAVTVTVEEGEFISGAQLDGAVAAQISRARRSAIADALRELADDLEAED
jgi:cytidine deaminase